MSAQDKITAQPVSSSKQPLVWLILADKHGDNAQVGIVEQRLPWRCIRKNIKIKEAFAVKKPRVKASLHHIDMTLSDPLIAPWPDIILSVGRRPSMVALWVKQQSAGHSKIVLFGKPSSRAGQFELIVTSSEILMPPLANILSIDCPLMRVDQVAIDAAAKQWSASLNHLPKPLHAVLIGGPTKPYKYNQKTAQALLDHAQQIVCQQQGSAYLVTSRRTPAAIVDLLQQQLPTGALLYRWDSRAADNPYKALLGTADAFTVTADSISMIVEVVRIGKPLAIMALDCGLFGGLDQDPGALTRDSATVLSHPDIIESKNL
jgi:mitochondrial fission protein ELM1